MAIVRTALGTGSNKSSGIEFSPVIATAGDQFIVVAAGDSIDTSVTYGSQNFTLDVSATNSGNVVAAIWRLSNPIPGTNSVTTNLLTSHAACLLRITGLAASPFDKSSTGTGTGLTPSSGATGTTIQEGELIIGSIGWEGPVEDQDGTWQNSFSAGQQAGTTGGGAASNITVDEGYRIVSATGAYTAALTRTLNGRDWAAAIATYRAKEVDILKLNQSVKRASYF
jgi:hypothetical protein